MLTTEVAAAAAFICYDANSASAACC